MVLSAMIIGIVKDYGRKLISVLTFRIGCPISVKFGTMGLKVMFWSICKVCENRRMEGLIFYGRA